MANIAVAMVPLQGAKSWEKFNRILRQNAVLIRGWLLVRGVNPNSIGFSPDMDRFEISVRPFLTVFSTPNRSVFSPFFKISTVFQNPTVLKDEKHIKNTFISSLSGCFRFAQFCAKHFEINICKQNVLKILELAPDAATCA